MSLHIQKPEAPHPVTTDMSLGVGIVEAQADKFLGSH